MTDQKDSENELFSSKLIGTIENDNREGEWNSHDDGWIYFQEISETAAKCAHGTVYNG